MPQCLIASSRIRNILVFGIFLIIVFLAFGHSLFQDFAPIDDTLLVRENLAIRGSRSKTSAMSSRISIRSSISRSRLSRFRSIMFWED